MFTCADCRFPGHASFVFFPGEGNISCYYQPITNTDTALTFWVPLLKCYLLFPQTANNILAAQNGI